MVAYDRSRKKPDPRVAPGTSAFPGPAGRTRRALNKARVRERLYQAALDLFRTQGYEATSVQQIADRADAGKSTFFNHFPTKEHVLAAYHDEMTARILAGLERSRPRSARGALRAALKLCAAEVRGELPLARAIYRTIFVSDVLLTADLENEKKFAQWFLARIQEGVASGELDGGLDAGLFLEVLINILSSTVKDWVTGSQDFDLERALERKLSFILSGASPRP